MLHYACETNIKIPIWQNPKKKLIKSIKNDITHKDDKIRHETGLFYLPFFFGYHCSKSVIKIKKKKIKNKNLTGGWSQSGLVLTVPVVGLQELFESKNMMSMIKKIMIQYGDFIFLNTILEILVQISTGLVYYSVSTIKWAIPKQVLNGLKLIKKTTEH